MEVNAHLSERLNQRVTKSWQIVVEEIRPSHEASPPVPHSSQEVTIGSWQRQSDSLLQFGDFLLGTANNLLWLCNLRSH